MPEITSDLLGSVRRREAGGRYNPDNCVLRRLTESSGLLHVCYTRASGQRGGILENCDAKVKAFVFYLTRFVTGFTRVIHVNATHFNSITYENDVENARDGGITG
jgi:hypothetical protein